MKVLQISGATRASRQLVPKVDGSIVNARVSIQRGITVFLCWLRGGHRWQHQKEWFRAVAILAPDASVAIEWKQCNRCGRFQVVQISKYHEAVGW